MLPETITKLETAKLETIKPETAKLEARKEIRLQASTPTLPA